MTVSQRTWVIALGWSGSLLVLRSTVPDAARLAQQLAHPQAWVDAVGPDAAAVTIAGALCWLAVGWLAIGLGLTLVAMLPGRLGALADAVLGRVAPAALRHGVAVALGLGVLTNASAWADTGPPAQSPVAVDWPTQHGPGSLDWPTRAPTDGPTAAPGAVRVVPGDTLWGIAAARLAPDASAAQIAVSVRRWFAANQAVIGADPDLIQPGQALIPPPDAPG